MSDVTNKISSSRDSDNNGSIRGTCPLSQFGCKDGPIDESSWEEHFTSEKHQRSLVRCAQQIAESTDDGSTEADADMEEGMTPSLVNSYDGLSVITNSIVTANDELSRLDEGIFRFKNQIPSFIKEVNDVETELLSEKSQFDAISMNQNVVKQDIISLTQDIENDSQIIKQEPDGTYIWKLTNVREKMYDAQSERQTSVYSSSFFTSDCGYHVCMRLYLNGDGSARGSYVSIFLVILRGPYDSILRWPFSYRVSFCLFDQRTMLQKNGTVQPKHIIESFRPDTNSISFEHPRSRMNIASGIPRFVSLNEISDFNDENLYVVNDTIYIKMFIDFVGMPRSILPFIFNINPALPSHIQQKLISDEMKRREEEGNTSL